MLPPPTSVSRQGSNHNLTTCLPPASWQHRSGGAEAPPSTPRGDGQSGEGARSHLLHGSTELAREREDARPRIPQGQLQWHQHPCTASHMLGATAACALPPPKEVQALPGGTGTHCWQTRHLLAVRREGLGVSARGLRVQEETLSSLGGTRPC